MRAAAASWGQSSAACGPAPAAAPAAAASNRKAIKSAQGRSMGKCVEGLARLPDDQQAAGSTGGSRRRRPAAAASSHLRIGLGSRICRLGGRCQCAAAADGWPRSRPGEPAGRADVHTLSTALQAYSLFTTHVQHICNSLPALQLQARRRAEGRLRYLHPCGAPVRLKRVIKLNGTRPAEQTVQRVPSATVAVPLLCARCVPLGLALPCAHTLVTETENGLRVAVKVTWLRGINATHRSSDNATCGSAAAPMQAAAAGAHSTGAAQPSVKVRACGGRCERSPRVVRIQHANEGEANHHRHRQQPCSMGRRHTVGAMGARLQLPSSASVAPRGCVERTRLATSSQAHCDNHTH